MDYMNFNLLKDSPRDNSDKKSKDYLNDQT